MYGCTVKARIHMTRTFIHLAQRHWKHLLSMTGLEAVSNNFYRFRTTWLMSPWLFQNLDSKATCSFSADRFLPDQGITFLGANVHFWAQLRMISSSSASPRESQAAHHSIASQVSTAAYVPFAGALSNTLDTCNHSIRSTGEHKFRCPRSLCDSYEIYKVS